MAKTTVAEIRAAPAEPVTVYNHFADLNELLPACSADYMAQHPLPDFAAASRWRTRASASARCWARSTPGTGRPSRCSASCSATATVPELDRFMGQNIDRMQGELADDLAAPFGARGRRLVSMAALIRVAVDAFTWRR